MAVKIDLTIITKNHAADSEKGFLAKSISKSNSCASHADSVEVNLEHGHYYEQ